MEIKNCPFCGNEDIEIYNFKKSWTIACSNQDCGAELNLYRTEEKAIQA